MSTVDVPAVMTGLKGFQRDAVDHVIERLYGPGSAGASGRFLVADETGLGKSIVARGVIKVAAEQITGAAPITEKVADTKGLSFEKIAWEGINQLDRLDGNFVSVGL